MNRTLRRVIFGVGAIILLAFAWMGVRGAFDQFSQTSSAGQELQSVAQLAFGVLGLVNLIVWFATRRWSPTVLIAWALSVALAGGLAPVVWGEASVATGVLSGVASLLIAWGIIWLLRFGSRDTA